MKIERRWQDGVMLILGLWLMASPLIFTYADLTGVSALNSYVFGAAIAICAIFALARPQMWEEWVNLVLGLWLIVAPFVLGFSKETIPAYNHFIIGVLVALDALVAMYPTFTRKAT